MDQGSESSISCHFQLPQCIYPRRVRFRVICTKLPAHSDARAFSRCASVRIRKTPVCSRSRSRSRALAQTPAHSRTLAFSRCAPAHPRPLPKRRRDGVCAPSRLSASRYLNRLPLWARPLSVGFRMPPAPSGCGRHPIVGRFASFAAHWRRAIELVGIRRAACSQLARCLQARACSSSAYGCVTWGPRNRPQTTYLRMTFWPLSSSLRAQWPQWYSASASDTVPSPNIKRCVPR